MSKQPPKPPLKEDPLARIDREGKPLHPDTLPGSVLLSDQIEYYCRKLDPPLISTADYDQIPEDEFRDCIDGASYKLRLGDEAHVGGKWVRIDENNPLVLQPHQVAVVKTYESVNVPRFLVARWNLRVTWVYEGLLWVGGPQEDPGWTGQLFCPIYNLAEREVVIKHKDRVFTIDFTRTSPFHEQPASYGYKSEVRDHQGGRYTLQDHDRNRLRSAPFEELLKLSSLDNKVNTFITFTVIILGVLISALSVVAVLANPAGEKALQGVTSNHAVLPWIALIASFASLIVVSVLAGSPFISSLKKNVASLLLFIFLPVIFLTLGGGFAVWLFTSGVPEDIPVILKGILIASPIVATIIGLVLLFILWKEATNARDRSKARLT